MKKGLKALSAALTLSVVLSSGVFAADWTKSDMEMMDKLFGGKVATKTVEKTENTLYNGIFSDPMIKKMAAKYQEAIDEFKADAQKVAEISKLYCEAKMAGLSAKNELAVYKKLFATASEMETLTAITMYKKINAAGNALEEAELLPANTMILKADSEELAKLLKANKAFKDGDLQDAAAQAGTLTGIVGKAEKSMSEVKKNIKALEDLMHKVKGYQDFAGTLKEKYGTEAAAIQHGLDLQKTAQEAAGLASLIEKFAEGKFTLLACPLDDNTFVPSANAKKEKEEAKTMTKKDQVPNTAVNGFAFYVPSVAVDVQSCVAYYGAPDFAKASVHATLDCSKEEMVEEKVVKVPFFTFDQLASYMAGFCSDCMMK